MLRLVKYFYFLLALYVCFEIIRISVPYYTPDFSRGFLVDKEEIWHFYQYALYLHIIFAPIAFLLTIPQLVWKYTKYHPFIGKAYVSIVLFLAGPSGLIMSFYAFGGGFGKILFLSLSVLWITYTYLANSHIRKGNSRAHIHFARGSFILCNSAILLRLFHYLNIKLDLIHSEHTYLILSFLSWVPFLVGYEIYHKLKKSA
ncbi:MAG: DUF2306 domain-containing protein [Crocinitomicaceae bacterium]|nr:DUF2306 domain-containing protein [Crocinitomicaceae bacterium]